MAKLTKMEATITKKAFELLLSQTNDELMKEAVQETANKILIPKAGKPRAKKEAAGAAKGK